MPLTIRTIGTCASLLLLPLSVGCTPLIADASGSSGGESASGSSSTGEDSTSSEDETTAASGVDSTSGSPASSSTSTSTTDGSDGSTSTGEDLPAPDVELLMRHSEGDNEHLSLCQIFDGVAEPCQLLHEADTGRDWGRPVFLSGRRVLMTAQDGSDSELRIASLDGPPTTTRVDDPGQPHESGSTILVVPTDESVIYSNGDTAFRVALDGLDVVGTTTLGSHSAPFRPTLDPQGRYLLLEDSAAYRIGLDGSGVADITPEGAIPFLTVDGEGGFRSRSMGGGLWRLEYVTLGEGVGTPIQLFSDVYAPNMLADRDHAVRPHPSRSGVITPLDVEAETLYYVGMDAGAGLPPVALNVPGTTARLSNLAHEPPPWSPDGRWLVFTVLGFDSPNELWVADLGDAHQPTLTRVASGSSWQSYRWAADGSALYLTASSNVVDKHTERVLLTDEGPIAQVVGAPGDSPTALSPDGRTLVVTQDEDSPGPSLYVIDVGGPELGERVLAAESVPGGRYFVGLFSNDSRFYAYNRDEGGEYEVFVASMDDPSAPHNNVGPGVLWAVLPDLP